MPRVPGCITRRGVEADWRLAGQEEWLVGLTLHRRPYFLWPEDWDHDHCEFCWAKFELPGGPRSDSLTEGWTTEDECHWLCDTCFADFRDRFKWTIRPRLPSDRPDTPRE